MDLSGNRNVHVVQASGYEERDAERSLRHAGRCEKDGEPTTDERDDDFG